MTVHQISFFKAHVVTCRDSNPAHSEFDRFFNVLPQHREAETCYRREDGSVDQVAMNEIRRALRFPDSLMGKSMNVPKSGFKRVALNSAKLWIVYAVATALIIMLEVWFDAPLIGKWGFVLCSILYLAAELRISFIALENAYLAILVAFLSAAAGFFAVIVVGVNFKFLIGGSL